MSKLIPRSTIDALRQNVVVALDMTGIDCDLYIPNNSESVESEDAYATPASYTYTHYTTDVFIEWSPNTHRLRALGLFTDDTNPIICKFPHKGVNDSGVTVAMDPLINSYFSIDPEYVPSNFSGFDEFLIVDIQIPAMHDAAIVKYYKVVPRRKETSSG